MALQDKVETYPKVKPEEILQCQVGCQSARWGIGLLAQRAHAWAAGPVPAAQQK